MIVAIVNHLSPAGLAEAPGLRGDAEILRLAAVEQQANREKLRTWSAGVGIETEIRSGNDILHSASAIVEFVYDQAQGTYWTWAGKAKPSADGEPVSPGEGATGLTLAKEGVTYYRPAVPSAELPRGEMVAVHPSPGNPSERPGINRGNFDPMYFYRFGDEDIAERFLWYHGFAKTTELDHDSFERSVERNGSLVTLEIRYPSGLNRYVVDLDRGGNLVTYFADEHSKVVVGTEEHTYEYEQVEGVWVPKLITLVAMSEDGPTRKTTVSRWLKNEVNGAIAPDKFTVEAVRIRPGELVQDTRTKAMYVYGSPESPQRAQSSRVAWAWPAALALLALAIALAWLVRARRRRRVP